MIWQCVPFVGLRNWVAGLALCSSLACAPDSLPEDLDGLVHYAWEALESGSTEELASVFFGLDQNVGADSLESVFEGGLSELSEEQAAMAGVNRDASIGHGPLHRTRLCMRYAGSA